MMHGALFNELLMMHHFAVDSIIWFLVARVVLTVILGIMLWIDPVLCGLHTNWYHKLFALGFFALAYSNMDRLLNRMVALYDGRPIQAGQLIDSEVVFTSFLLALVAVTVYDHFKNKERIALNGDRVCGGWKSSD